MFLPELTWPEVAEVLQKTKTVLVPVGSTEQHGPHLPVNNDAFTAEALCRKIAAASEAAGIPVAVSTCIAIGLSEHHMDFPGSLTLSPETFQRVVKEVCTSLYHHGFRNIVLVNAHGGNSSALALTASDLAHTYRDAKFMLLEWWHLIGSTLQKVVETGLFHGCEGETSLSLALGQRVLMDKAEAVLPESSSAFVDYNLFTSKPGLGWTISSMKDITPTGVVGDPTKATHAKGDALLTAVLKLTTQLMAELAAGIN
ncbi:MAG TPA: creatininase family protein [Firmicutes bacterium]|nr:creatinine amidohydrolase [Bacillota bacterium]HHV56584.1 creatininase family protein [Bacillota bacterium]